MKTIAYVRSTNVYDDSRATKEIIALAQAGYHVQVLAWDRDGYAEERCGVVFDALREYVTCRFYSVEMKNGIGMKNITKLLGWFEWVYKTLKNCGKLDAVHACDLDAGISAHRFCRAARVPLIYDIYDYYVDAHPVPAAAAPLVEAMEISVINSAAATIICTEERREQIAKAAPRKLAVIHNSPDVKRTEPVKATCDYAYCGSLADLRLVKEILGQYPEHSEMRFKFAGYGKYVPAAEQLAQEYDNFEFLGALQYSEVLEVEAQAMAIAAIYEPTIRNHRLCAPNKFYEAMALTKPVIVCRGTGIDKIVEQNGIGIVIDYDAGQFYQALEYLKANPAIQSEMGERARRLYDQKYTWAAMEEILLEVYQDVVPS